jgi:hypothetical protein
LPLIAGMAYACSFIPLSNGAARIGGCVAIQKGD